MTTIYKLVNWRFNGALFAEHIQNAIDAMGSEVLAKAVGVHPQTVSAWGRGGWKADFPFPSMSNFLTTCNALDLDPRKYWILEDNDEA